MSSRPRDHEHLSVRRHGLQIFGTQAGSSDPASSIKPGVVNDRLMLVERIMRFVFASTLVFVFVGAPAFAGQHADDASLERIKAALSAPAGLTLPIVVERPMESWGGITLVQPDVTGGQFVQVRVPVGELVMKAVRAVGNARYERAQRKAHEQVARELQEFLKQQK